MFAFLKQFQYYAFAAILAAVLGAWALDHKSQYDKGYAANEQAHVAVVEKYQQLIIAEQQKSAVELAKLASDHAEQITKIEADKPKQVEKTRVIVKTIDRPAVCDLHDDELLDFNEAVDRANRKE